MRRALLLILTGLLIGVGSWSLRAAPTPGNGPPANPPSVPQPTLVPGIVAVNTPTLLTASVFMPDPTLNPAKVQLIQVGSDGQMSVVSQMRDDGQQGDLKAGDKVFTAQLSVTETRPGAIAFLVSAVFRGQDQVRSNSTSISVWLPFRDVGTGIAFSYPQFAPIQQVITSSISGGSDFRIEIQTLNASNGQYMSLVGMRTYSNPPAASLGQWFHSNIDPAGLLAASGTFRQVTMGNSVPALILDGPIPDQYLSSNGPVDEIYAMSPITGRIIAMTQGQEEQLGDFGYEPATTLKQILSTMQF